MVESTGPLRRKGFSGGKGSCTRKEGKYFCIEERGKRSEKKRKLCRGCLPSLVAREESGRLRKGEGEGKKNRECDLVRGAPFEDNSCMNLEVGDATLRRIFLRRTTARVWR